MHKKATLNIVTVSCDPLQLKVLVDSFRDKEIADRVRLWVATDDRPRPKLPASKDAWKLWRARPAYPEFVKKQLQIARADGLPVYPYLISGKILTSYFNDVWKLDSIQREFRSTHPMTVKNDIIYGIKDLYGVDDFIYIDEDIRFFENPERLFEYDYAMASEGIFNRFSTKEVGINAMRAYSRCANWELGFTHPDEAITMNNKQTRSGGVLRVKDPEDYGRGLKAFFTDPYFIKLYKDMLIGKKPGMYLRSSGQVYAAIHQLANRGHIYGRDEVQTTNRRIKPKIDSGLRGAMPAKMWPRSKTPVIYHYAVKQDQKWLAAEWVASLKENMEGKGYICHPDFFKHPKNEPSIETRNMYREEVYT